MENSKYQYTSSSSKREIICYLLREYYKLGWCTGSGGGISIKESESSYLVAPSGVNKEFVEEEDIFEIDVNENVIQQPQRVPLKMSECTPLFMQAYKLRKAGAVIHSHSINALLITKLFETEFQCVNIEMIKGIIDHKYSDFLIVPIINNTERECDLTSYLNNAIISYPRTYAVLVRNHGVYIWGPTWEKTKLHAECYEYLFKTALKMHKYNFSLPKILAANSKLRSWIIDESQNDKDIRNALQHRNNLWVSPEELEEFGILYWKLSGERDSPQLEEIVLQRNYKNRDEKIITAKMENYEEMISIFKKEHLHEDEEIRYVLSGSGYFDVRNKKDEWVRIHVVKGDLLILPEGIYHRFVPDLNNFIHVIRLFKDEPKWIAINRPAEDYESRKKYIKLYYHK